MSAFLYGVGLQLKMDMRSKTHLVTCYLVPLLFFALMGGIFTSVMPEMSHTLIQSMIVMGVSMGAFLGLPPTIAEAYSSEIKKVYKANGVPLQHGLFAMLISSFIHLFIMCVIIYTIAPIAFEAALPESPLLFFCSLAIFIIVSLSIGCVLGLAVNNQAKLTMISQIVFLPSIMLSGIMFPAEFLPQALQTVGKVFPASWGYPLLTDNGLQFHNVLPLLVILASAIIACCILPAIPAHQKQYRKPKGFLHRSAHDDTVGR